MSKKKPPKPQDSRLSPGRKKPQAKTPKTELILSTYTEKIWRKGDFELRYDLVNGVTDEYDHEDLWRVKNLATGRDVASFEGGFTMYGARGDWGVKSVAFSEDEMAVKVKYHDGRIERLDLIKS
jgi:hypothetical protein